MQITVSMFQLMSVAKGVQGFLFRQIVQKWPNILHPLADALAQYLKVGYFSEPEVNGLFDGRTKTRESK